MRYTSKNAISISIEFVHMALSKLSIEQSKIDDLLHACRIPRHLLNEPCARVSLLQFAQLMRGLTLATNDEYIGHGSTVLPMGSLSLLTHWLISAKSLEQAADRIPQFYDLLGQGQTIHSDTDRDGIVFEIDLSTSGFHSNVFIAELCFSNIHRLLCWLAMEIIPIEYVSFQSSEPAYAQDYRLLFFGAPIFFKQTRTQIRFSHETLKKPVQQTLNNLEPFLKNPNFELLVMDFKADNLASYVAAEIRQKLNDMPTLPELANTMSMKPYTLQRRLANEGINYLTIKNQVKRDAAIDLLVNTDLSIEAISTQLGFSETSPFTRTFKEWTGIPPSAYRKYQ